jgi:hypothetical protein
MKRSHRRLHRLAWPLLLVLVAVAVTLALVERPAVPQNLQWPQALAASP